MSETGSDSCDEKISTGSESGDEKISARYLQCSECGKQYGSGDMSPRVLPCLHSFCIGCLDQRWDWATSALTCPICCSTWNVEGSVAETFPVNFVAMKLLTLAKVENSRTVQCTDCDSNKAATHRCMECHHFICADGYRAHKQFIQLQSHHLLPISDFLKSPSDMFKKEDTCDIHLSQPLDLFCHSDTCKMPVCASCALIAHKEAEGHNLGKLKECYTSLADRSRGMIEDLFIRLEDTKEEVKTSEDQMRRLQDRGDAIRQDINKVFDELLESLQARRQSLLQCVEDVVKREQGEFQQLSSQITASEKKIRDAIEYANQALSVCSYAEFMTLSQHLEDTLTRFQKESLYFHFVEKDLQFDSTKLEEFKSTITYLGDIVQTSSESQAWKPVVETVDSHPGHETNIMEVKFLNEISKMAASDIPKIEVKVERSDPANAARILRLQSHGENRKAAYKVRFASPRDVMYKAKLKIGHMRLEQEVFPFRCTDERGEGRDRVIHIGHELLGEGDKWAFTRIKCPHIRLSEETVNTDWCRIRERTVLVNKPSMKQSQDTHLRLRSYPGAVATSTINMEGKCYWEVFCRTQVKQRWWGSIFEAGVARRMALDTPYIVGYSPFGWTLQVVYCTVHRSVCLQARNNRQTLYDLPIISEDLESVVEVHIGFLLDFDTSRLHIIDVHNDHLVYTFHGLDSSKQLWSFCGIFNNNWYSTEVKVLSGADLNIEHQLLRLLETLCLMV